jgi:hypothetical protein
MALKYVRTHGSATPRKIAASQLSSRRDQVKRDHTNAIQNEPKSNELGDGSPNDQNHLRRFD